MSSFLQSASNGKRSKSGDTKASRETAPREAAGPKSHEWTDWHLTPRGWEVGSRQTDAAGVTEKPAPVDRALTCRYDEYLSSIYSRTHRSVAELWRSQDSVQVEALLARYGACPREL